MFWKLAKRKKVNAILAKHKNTFSFDKQLNDLMQKEPKEIIFRHFLLIKQMNDLILGCLNEGKEVHFCVGSRFLRENYEIFCRSEKESVHLVTGVEVGILKHLDEKIILEHEVRELLQAKIFDSEINKCLQNLHFEGYRLFGCFHIHPWSGVGATTPSGIDMELIDKFEAGNYKTVSAIFSRDGFIRFMAPFPFKIHIYGKGVKKINEELYCLVKVS